MDTANEFELVVSEGKLPIWRAVLAAALFTFLCYQFYDVVMLLYYRGFDVKFSKIISGKIEVIGFCLAGGVTFATRKMILIDVDKDKLVSRFLLGPFTRDWHTTIPDLEYVSVFLDTRENYQVNLWYKGNKHFKMCRFSEKRPAHEFAEYVARKLDIDLLDATKKGESKWIEMSRP